MGRTGCWSTSSRPVRRRRARPGSPAGRRRCGGRRRSRCGPFAPCCRPIGCSAWPTTKPCPALLVESAEHQQEVTDQLGTQVRKAVELLVQTFDRLDRESSGEALAEVGEKTLYEAALTVMMRLVFLLCAEERDLLPLSLAGYADDYAAAILRERLRTGADEYGEEILERHHDAWVRLLALSRAVHGGIEHPDLRLPAYGGTLFDPDRFPFLEGRPAGSSWREQVADPPAVDNRTVLHLLDALQSLEIPQPGRGIIAVPVSFRALDIEQIGHVYEGLLDHTAVRAAGPALSLTGAGGKEPEIPLEELEAVAAKGRAALVKFLKKATGRSKSAIENGLDRAAGDLDDDRRRAFRTLCGGCVGLEAGDLWERVKPFADLVRDDPFDRPVVILPSSVYVTAGTDRRSTGTHYTPRTLTEPIVRHTLEPLCYDGPAEGKPEDEWELRSAEELLALNVCDMTCGSGAFLVESCRYLADRLVQAWDRAERDDPAAPGITPFGASSKGVLDEQLIPVDPEERLNYARRLLAQSCLYGVDKNPLAAEIAKLSLWLLTLAKDRPFTFLEHAIRSGDALAGVEGSHVDDDRPGLTHTSSGDPLLGIESLKQLERFNLDWKHGDNDIFLQFMEGEVQKARGLRAAISLIYSTSIRHTREQERLFREYQSLMDRLRCVADFLISVELRKREGKSRKRLHNDAAIRVSELYYDAPLPEFRAAANEAVGDRRPLHWPVEFLNVLDLREGFDAFVGNPPFMGGQKITGNHGTAYRNYLVEHLANGVRGSADLCAYFFLRARQLLRAGGTMGLIATNTVAQGDTREVGLDQLLSGDCVAYRAESSRSWPGQANLEISQVWLRQGEWRGEQVLDGEPVAGITSHLTEPGAVVGDPYRLKANEGKSFQGSIVLGMGFVLEPEQAHALIGKNPKNRDVLFPYLNGQDLNSRPDQSPSRWVINFHDWPLDRTADGAWDGANAARHKAWLQKGQVPADYPDPVAADYPECLTIIERDVKPEREKNKYSRSARVYWWHYERARDELYEAISGFGTVFASTRVTKFLSVSHVPTDQVLTVDLAVHALTENKHFCTLSSTFFEDWTWSTSSTHESRLRFVISDSFETFPFPPPHTEAEALDRIGGLYHFFRRSIMLARQEGLTKTYNRFHDEGVESSGLSVDRATWRDVLDDFNPEAGDPAGDEAIDALRTLHAVMDHAVAAAYGWDDLDLDHGFHDTKQGVRFTLAEAARKEVLQRLLKLNHDRYAEEVAAGLHDKGRKKSGKAKQKSASQTGAGLFDG